MDCYVCETELIWSGDEEAEDLAGNKIIETVLTCPGCRAITVVYRIVEYNEKNVTKTVDTIQ